MTLPPLPPLPEPDRSDQSWTMGGPSWDYFLSEKVAAYAQAYGRLCAEAEREACLNAIDGADDCEEASRAIRARTPA